MADPIGSFQGLASGIDFAALVDAVIAAEATPVRLLDARKTELDRRSTAWSDIQLRVQSAFDRAKDLADPTAFNVWKTNITGGEAGFSATAGETALPGSYSVEVLQLASRERVASDTFQERNTALGLSGEFVVDGRAVQVIATDTLADVAASINAAGAQGTGGGPSATITGATTGQYRLVIGAGATGQQGLSLNDGADGLLRTFGFLDDTVSIRNQTSNGARSDAFASSVVDIASSLGLANPPASASVSIGGLAVTIDLSTDSLSDIAAAINTAAASAGSAVEAQVVSEADADGNTVRRLDVGNTTAFTDANGILETIGVLSGGREAIAQQVQGAAFTAAGGATPATGATLLTDLWVDGENASVQAGDTLTMQGMRGDGSTFTKTFTVGAADTYQDVIDSLNASADAFGATANTATASIVDGRVTVTDDFGGSSRLALSIVSNNEGGGSLDFGDFATIAEGRDREVARGTDAELLVDGAFYTRTTNSLSDVLTGVTLSLSATSVSGPSVVEIERDVDAVVAGVESFVQAFNAVSEFALGQFTGIGAEEGESARPLSGDSIVRQIRNQMRAVLQTTISTEVSGFGTMQSLGIEAARDGTYDIDTAALRAAIEQDATGVQRLFSAFGGVSGSSLDYVSAGAEVQPGTYDVFITTPPTQAAATSSGFGGTYVDDLTPDTITISDLSTGAAYDTELTLGMTVTDIVDAINAQFGEATSRELTAPNTLASDILGTPATEGTVLADLRSGGFSVGVATGDTFTISGTLDDGSSVFRQWTVADASTQTLGALRQELSAAMGSEVAMSVVDGQLTATAVSDGTAGFTLSLSSDNAGGGTFSQGAFGVTEAGRPAATMEASDVGGEVRITHDDFGVATGFSIAYTGGGTDGSGSLGLAAGDYYGVDIQGTIGGHPATSEGKVLTGAEGTPVEGLALGYRGADVGSVGSVTFSRGLASMMEKVTDRYLDGGDSSIQGIQERIDTQKRGIDQRIDRFEDRLEVRRQNLIKKFTALEEALAQAQSEGAWIQAQLGTLFASPSS